MRPLEWTPFAFVASLRPTRSARTVGSAGTCCLRDWLAFREVPGSYLARTRDVLLNARSSAARFAFLTGSLCGSLLRSTLRLLRRERGNITCDMQQRLALDNEGLKLPGRKQGVDHFAHARTGRQWREKRLDIFFRRGNCLTKIEGDQRGESCGLSGIGPRLDLLNKASGSRFPYRVSAIRLKQRNDAQV